MAPNLETHPAYPATTTHSSRLSPGESNCLVDVYVWGKYTKKAVRMVEFYRDQTAGCGVAPDEGSGANCSALHKFRRSSMLAWHTSPTWDPELWFNSFTEIYTCSIFIVSFQLFIACLWWWDSTPTNFCSFMYLVNWLINSYHIAVWCG